MSSTHADELRRTDNAGEPTTPVWDIWVRLFHWSFAALIVAAWLTHRGEGGTRFWHELLGYGAVALVVLRIIWGFVGTKYARFRAFVPSPTKLVKYTTNFISGRESRYVSHNPFGALMVLLLLALSIGLAVTGFFLTHHEVTLFGLGRRPLHQLHDLMGNLYIVAIPVHVLGVVFESLRHRENLLGAMLTGRKRAPDEGDVA